ncbi:conserved hypothetical protein (plasmid) [Borreliella burgdorferi Bol26]|nr:conserved hypothetical protein [Borreliella burgdorferi 156a]ACO38004.1 conserved hypothetical protein [Borreliella burgdorferi Bol26]
MLPQFIGFSFKYFDYFDIALFFLIRSIRIGRLKRHKNTL